MHDAVDQSRESFGRQAWAAAHAGLSAADRQKPLELEDLERLAVAAYLVGEDSDSDGAWTRAYQACLRHGDTARAVRCAFWLSFGLFNRGDLPRGSGWVARAQRLLADGQRECVEQGYLLYLAALRAIFEGDDARAYALFAQAAEIGGRFRDPDLVTLARLGQGRALIRLGRTAEGVALLDEAMVAVTAGEVSPIVAGDTYCSLIEACQEMFDLRRAHLWTNALSQWCDAQPDLVSYRGQCLVHRAEIQQLRGAWRDAMEEAERACQRLSHPAGQLALGAAFYQLAELHRLRGRFAPAEEAYRQASELGRDPQPGLAQLRQAQGRIDAAAAAIGRAADEARDRATRSRLLPACVEIMVAAGDTRTARAAAEELAELSADFEAPLLRALAAHVTGAVLLAEDDARAALTSLRQACTAWRELEAPYETARVRVLIGVACRRLGDEDTATMELDAARRIFEQLGAAPDLARADALVRSTTPDAAHGLTPRELRVLRLVATGETNKASLEHFEGGYTVCFESHTADADLGGLFRGLPDDRCDFPRWGYVVAGTTGFRFADHEETFQAGDAYYVPAGHTPVHYAGTEIIEFSPTGPLGKAIGVVVGNLRAAGVEV